MFSWISRPLCLHSIVPKYFTHPLQKSKKINKNPHGAGRVSRATECHIRFAIYFWTKECLQPNYFAISTRQFIVLSQAKEPKCWCTKTIWIENHSYGTNAFISGTRRRIFFHSSVSPYQKNYRFEMLNECSICYWVESSSVFSKAKELFESQMWQCFLSSSLIASANSKYQPEICGWCFSYFDIVLFGPNIIALNIIAIHDFPQSVEIFQNAFEDPTHNSYPSVNGAIFSWTKLQKHARLLLCLLLH